MLKIPGCEAIVWASPTTNTMWMAVAAMMACVHSKYPRKKLQSDVCSDAPPLGEQHCDVPLHRGSNTKHFRHNVTAAASRSLLKPPAHGPHQLGVTLSNVSDSAEFRRGHALSRPPSETHDRRPTLPRRSWMRMKWRSLIVHQALLSTTMHNSYSIIDLSGTTSSYVENETVTWQDDCTRDQQLYGPT